MSSPLLPAVGRWFAAAALLVGAAAAPIDEMEVPVGQQVSLLTRVLSFDRSLAGTAPLVVAVVYQPRNRVSRQASETAAAAFSGVTVQGRPVRVVAVPLRTLAEAADGLRRAEVAYVAPLRGVDVGALARAGAASGVRVVTGVRRYVEAGAAVGIGLRDGRPEILVHRRAAEMAGADFSARLLQLATLVD